MRNPILKILGVLGMATVALGVSAQELNESLYVEGEYIPDIIRMEKLHILPTKVSFDLTANPPAYSLTGVATNYNPDILALPTQSWRASRAGLTRRGYFDLGAGTNLNVVGSAGYRFLNTDKMKAGIMLQHNSTALFKPKVNEWTENLRRRRYDEALGLYGSFLTDNGTLDASIYYHLGWFNYYGQYIPENRIPYRFSTQTLNDLTFRLAWKGIGAPVDYSASAGVKYFGYRDLPLDDQKGSRETNIMLNGNVEKAIDSSKIGILADIDLLLYNDNNKGVDDSPYPSVDNYSKVTLTPYYRYVNGNVSAQLGANVDLTVNAGNKGDRYSTVHISPASYVQWSGRGLGAYLRFDGGTHLQTLAERAKWDYYQCPVITNTLPVYSPIDATLGLNFGPWTGFTAGISAEYAYTKNNLLGGWYMSYVYGYLRERFMTIKGLKLAANAKYEYGNIFTVEGAIAYNNQNKEHGFFNGYDRPRWIIDAAVTMNPIDNLSVNLNYQYRGVRTIYEDGSEYVPLVMDYVGHRLPDLTLLGVGAKWQPITNLTIWGEVNNILGCKGAILPLQFQEGVNFAVGFGVTF
jgi:hypothetical protein